jgi:hypothetical protein
MRRTTFALAALSLFAAPALARPLDYQVEVGFFGGGHFFSDSNGLGRRPSDTADNALLHSALFGLRLGYVLHPLVALEGELGVMPTRPQVAPALVMGFGWRAHLLVHFVSGRIRPFALIGGGGMTSTSSNPLSFQQDTDGALHAGVGFKLDVRPNWGLRLDGRIVFVPTLSESPFTQDFEVTLGAYARWSRPKPPPPPPPDRDGDGVPDDVDHCPNEAGSLEHRGCPDPDTDGDGVPDRLDRCPTDPGGRADGCPAPPEAGGETPPEDKPADGAPAAKPAETKPADEP